ncbi:hypothetical protein IFM89_021088 [Coptis chinensis]|uniref:Protein ROOT INITIATION DEFECTIVE 3-like n=1 Tax=Coptis chinensis TaxID=261450 RepID=A0A835HNL9_9MAGN|nr:hypothetical protein IFM89_021088 [Coptis chinensis]
MASSSGEIVLASSPDNPITAYDASSGAILAHFKAGSPSPRRGLAVAGNAFIVASHVSYSHISTPTASLHLYNFWSPVAFSNLPLPEPVAPLAPSPDGFYIFCGGVSGYIHALMLPSGCLLRSFPAHSKPVSCCIINHDASLLISGGDDGTICVFPLIHLLDNGNAHLSINALYCFSAHTSSVTAIGASSPMIIISCSLDCTVKFWSLACKVVNLIRTVQFPCMLRGLALDSTESNFYVGGSDGHLYAGVIKLDGRTRHSGADAHIVALTPEHKGAVTAVAMTNEGRYLLSASEDGNVWIWEVEMGKVVRVFGSGRESISDIVVAKGIRDCSRRGVEYRGPSLGYSGREISRPVRELGEMETMLNVVVKDRRRAIDILEGTIETYRRLLRLILKEAIGGDAVNNNGNKDEGEE